MTAASRNALGIVAGLLEARTGQTLTPDRLWRVESALTGVLRRHDLPSLEALAARLALPNQGMLAQQVAEALLNNETYFFRDRALFDQLGACVLPALAARRGADRRLAIWSVGCSTGQEAYSLAMVLLEQPARWRGWSIEILGTDVASAMIDAAREGSFSQFQIQRGLTVSQMVRFFEETRTGWRARTELRGKVRFELHSVLDPPPEPRRFDLILCRNVLLYFDRPTRERAFARLAAALAPGGLLMLGSGETTAGQTGLLVPDGAFPGFHRSGRDAAATSALPGCGLAARRSQQQGKPRVTNP
jgi:chemotaxis protein methyltransferase CheR